MLPSTTFRNLYDRIMQLQGRVNVMEVLGELHQLGKLVGQPTYY